MPQITFEKLKQDCVKEFCSKNTSYGSEINTGGKLGVAVLVDYKRTGKMKHHRELLKEIENDITSLINSTDLRNLKPLISLCPESVPKWIQSGNYILDMADNGWTFCKK